MADQPFIDALRAYGEQLEAETRKAIAVEEQRERTSDGQRYRLLSVRFPHQNRNLTAYRKAAIPSVRRAMDLYIQKTKDLLRVRPLSRDGTHLDAAEGAVRDFYRRQDKQLRAGLEERVAKVMDGNPAVHGKSFLQALEAEAAHVHRQIALLRGEFPLPDASSASFAKLVTPELQAQRDLLTDILSRLEKLRPANDQDNSSPQPPELGGLVERLKQVVSAFADAPIRADIAEIAGSLENILANTASGAHRRRKIWKQVGWFHQRYFSALNPVTRTSTAQSHRGRKPRASPLFDGRYQILGKAGSGGQGTVYKAIDARPNTLGKKEVMIKFVRAGKKLSDDRFREETRAVLALHKPTPHPNIIEIWDTNVDRKPARFRRSRVWYYTMPVRRPLDQFGNIPNRIKDAPYSGLDVILPIMKGLLRGLARAQQRRLVHRDLKPENALLPLGDFPWSDVCISDFGLVKQYPRRTNPSERSRRTHGRPVGPYGYRAPELDEHDTDKGEPEHTFRSDLYSIGQIGLFLARGKPYHCSLVPKKCRDLAKTPLAPLAQHIRSLCQHNPARRPKTAGEALRLLEQALLPPTNHSSPSPAPPPFHQRPPSALGLDALELRKVERTAHRALADSPAVQPKRFGWVIFQFQYSPPAPTAALPSPHTALELLKAVREAQRPLALSLPMGHVPAEPSSHVQSTNEGLQALLDDRSAPVRSFDVWRLNGQGTFAQLRGYAEDLLDLPNRAATTPLVLSPAFRLVDIAQAIAFCAGLYAWLSRGPLGRVDIQVVHRSLTGRLLDPIPVRMRVPSRTFTAPDRIFRHTCSLKDLCSQWDQVARNIWLDLLLGAQLWQPPEKTYDALRADLFPQLRPNLPPNSSYLQHDAR